MISLSVEKGQLVEADFAEAPKIAQKAMVRGLNRAIGAARTLMAGEIARDMGLKVGDVKKAMSFQEATALRPIARLGAGTKRFSLAKFGARQTRSGVTYRLGGRKTIEGAFLAQMRSGHEGVFKRMLPSKRKSARGWSLNLPIDEKHGPSLGHVFEKFRPQGVARATEMFETTFAHEMNVRSQGVVGSNGAD